MNLSNSFQIAAPPDQAWDVLQDFATIARCMPGARLHEVRGDEVLGSVTVRLGPMKVEYDGVIRVVEQDASIRRMVMEGSGKDKRGGGTAKATIVAGVVEDAGGSVVNVDTELAITGRPAQMGQGLLQDVAERIIDQFAKQLETELSSSPRASETARPEREDPLNLGTAVAGPLLKRLTPVLVAIALALFVVWLLVRNR
ncbi:MAG TPA: carbon monoxide dehydrogenase [Actinobacteria bacterium]|nr:carbon monoxide dehydrogenase [Actinomycetota bacterium]